MQKPDQKDYDFNDNIEGVRFAKDMINYVEHTKLIHQLFIGKIVDIIGFDKTTELLKEAKDVIIPIYKKNN